MRCRLDRAATNTAWAENYPSARSQYLGFDLSSDHNPLISYFKPNKKKRKGLFRYDRRLKDNAEVKELVREAWQGDRNVPVSDRIAHMTKANLSLKEKESNLMKRCQVIKMTRA